MAIFSHLIPAKRRDHKMDTTSRRDDSTGKRRHRRHRRHTGDDRHW
jgi:hypothetical protein